MFVLLCTLGIDVSVWLSVCHLFLCTQQSQQLLVIFVVDEYLWLTTVSKPFVSPGIGCKLSQVTPCTTKYLHVLGELNSQDHFCTRRKREVDS